MKWNYRKLRGRIREICGTQEVFSELLGIGKVSLSKRLNNQLEFTQEEMYRACEILNINLVDLPLYFFTKEV